MALFSARSSHPFQLCQTMTKTEENKNRLYMSLMLAESWAEKARIGWWRSKYTIIWKGTLLFQSIYNIHHKLSNTIKSNNYNTILHLSSAIYLTKSSSNFNSFHLFDSLSISQDWAYYFFPLSHPCSYFLLCFPNLVHQIQRSRFPGLQCNPESLYLGNMLGDLLQCGPFCCGSQPPRENTNH